MLRLIHQPSQRTLIPRLELADSMWRRMKGLLGRTHLPVDQALWIPQCRSVHTFFMKFPIDLIFLDRDLVVRKTFKHVNPGRLIWPVWSASSVIELQAGFLDKNPIRVGEKLHVDSALS